MENVVSQYFATVQPMYDEVVEPSSIYADLILNNDGVANLAIDVLTVVFNQQLEKVSQGTLQKRAMSEEFTDEVFSSLIKKD